jgi:hypothetical protein
MKSFWHLNDNLWLPIWHFFFTKQRYKDNLYIVAYLAFPLYKTKLLKAYQLTKYQIEMIHEIYHREKSH